MPPGESLFSRISRSIQDRVAKSAEDNPDGALAKYVWLWQSMGRRPGRQLIPRPVRFFFVASLDLFSLVGWYIRTGILRVARSVGSKEAIMLIYRTKLVAVLTILFGMAIGGGLTFSFLALSGSEDVPIATSATSPHRPRFPSTFVLTGRRMEDDGMVFTGEFKIPGEFRTPINARVFTLMERGDFRPCFEYAPPFRITGLTFVSYSTWLPSSRGLACL